jgi:hypothetical protein
VPPQARGSEGSPRGRGREAEHCHRRRRHSHSRRPRTAPPGSPPRQLARPGSVRRTELKGRAAGAGCLRECPHSRSCSPCLRGTVFSTAVAWGRRLGCHQRLHARPCPRTRAPERCPVVRRRRQPVPVRAPPLAPAAPPVCYRATARATAALRPCRTRGLAAATMDLARACLRRLPTHRTPARTVPSLPAVTPVRRMTA